MGGGSGNKNRRFLAVQEVLCEAHVGDVFVRVGNTVEGLGIQVLGFLRNFFDPDPV